MRTIRDLSGGPRLVCNVLFQDIPPLATIHQHLDT
jgi:hypothetical protein